ncbi:MAG: ubiquitin carboxyl-terminal hydrolase [Verrucomicrobia bacterium]|nr:ubiquitin carboxyl-terminal hydrolase [Verrucomicrobiota bacterium]
MTISNFVEENINPKVQFFHDAILIGDYVKAEGYFHAIEDDIATAKAIYEDALANLASLDELSKTLKGRLQNRDLKPLEVTKYAAEMAPVGIVNEGGDDCWANAAIQLLANAPTAAKSILDNPEKRRGFPFLKSYFESQMHAKPVSTISSQAVRRALLGKVKGQQDAAEGLRGLMANVGFGFHIYEELSSKKGDGREQAEPEPMIQLDIPKSGSTVQTLVNQAFAPAILEDSSTKTTQLEYTPDDLFISVNRVEGKKNYEIDQTEQFTISSKFTRWNEPDIAYELKGCIVHLGKTGKSGHYVALLKKPDGWYVANDSKVTKLSDQQAREYLKMGYVFHYAKGKQSRSCWAAARGAGVVCAIARTCFQVISYPVSALWRFTGTSQ